VPIACNEIFTRIAKLKTVTTTFEVNVSMVEIYNERVQDLLIDPSMRPTGGLKVREHKITGVYVQDLSKHPVDSYDAIDAKMDQGQQNRTIGSTQMNATSSRAHTVITIELRQVEFVQGAPMEKFSVINLVDLAGSEKAGQTGAQGDRLKEGSSINLSLTMLGQCISILADKACGKRKNEIVPFRNSNLTRIL
jgi:kinesin family member 13